MNKTNMEKTIYELKLHEGLKVPAEYYVTRVPGGWLYADVSVAPYSNVFVPFSTELVDETV